MNLFFFHSYVYGLARLTIVLFSDLATAKDRANQLLLLIISYTIVSNVMCVCNRVTFFFRYVNFLSSTCQKFSLLHNSVTQRKLFAL